MLTSNWEEVARALTGGAPAADLSSESVAPRSDDYWFGAEVIDLPMTGKETARAFRTEWVSRVVVPVFNERAVPMDAVEAVVWAGRGEGTLATMTIARSSEEAWRLRAGAVYFDDEAWSVEAPKNDTADVRLVRVEVDPGEPPWDRSFGSSEAPIVASPQALVVSPTIIDILAVGLNDGVGGTVSPATLVSKSTNAAALLESALDNSSSASWPVSSGRAILRGAMMVTRLQGTAPSSDRNWLQTDSAVQSVAIAVGADVVAGYRHSKWSNGCGNALQSSATLVWTRKQTGCNAPDGQTFVHEMGHVLNGKHYHYYWDNSTSPTTRTVMYQNSSAGRQPQFSNPERDFINTSNPSGLTNRNNTERVYDHWDNVGLRRTFPGTSTPKRYTPLPKPVRILDTREPQGGLALLAANTNTRVAAAAEGMPPRASAVAMNITIITGGNANGAIRVKSSTSGLSTAPPVAVYRANDVQAQATVVKLDALKTFYIRSEKAIEAVIDVYGYFSDGPSGSEMHELTTPSRIYSQTNVPANTDIAVSMTACPSGSATNAAFVNVTVVAPSSPGYLMTKRVQDSDTDSFSSVNFSTGEVVGNGLIAPVANQKFYIRISSPGARVDVDLFGCLKPGTSGKEATIFTTPVTRLSNHALSGPAWAHRDISASGSVAWLSLQTTNNPQATFVVAHRYGSSIPGVSSFNPQPNERVANHGISRVSSGKVRLHRGPHAGTTYLSAVQVAYWS